METISFFAYDTLCSVSAVVPVGSGARDIVGETEKIARAVEDTLSMFEPESELSRLCAQYTPGVAYPVSDMLASFLHLNMEFADMTGGAFDPTVGPLVKLWDVLAPEPCVPSDADINAMLARVGYRHVAASKADCTVTFDAPGIVLDPGASGKGFALGLVAAFLRGCGVQQAVLDFGCNLYAIGDKPGAAGRPARPWRAGLRHPDKLDAVMGTVELCGRGVATSSWYEHSFQKDGVVYHHLLDPRTGRPKSLEISSVSILSSHAVYTDLMSTAFFMLGVEEGERLIARLAQKGIDIDYVAVLGDGAICHSPGAGFLPA